MKNTLWLYDWLGTLLVAGCTSKTPTAVSSTNEQKVISTTETSSSVQQEATTTSERVR